MRQKSVFSHSYQVLLIGLFLLVIQPGRAAAADLTLSFEVILTQTGVGSSNNVTGLDTATVAVTATFANGTTWQNFAGARFAAADSHSFTISGATLGTTNGTYIDPDGLGIVCFDGFSCDIIDTLANFKFSATAAGSPHEIEFAFSLNPLVAFPSAGDFMDTSQFGAGFTGSSQVFDTLASSSPNINSYDIDSITTPPTYSGGPTGGAAACGDGSVDGGETCDDGGTTPGDGCSATCTVEAGFTCTGTTPSVCTDDNECTLGTDNCDVNATCTNTPGSFTCGCNAGYSGDGVTCTDDNECTLGTDNCDVNATCTNTPGAFTCACNAGYSGNGVTCTLVGVCGDGTPEAAEECDLGATNGDPDVCCSGTCMFVAASTECRAAAGVCDQAEVCDGASAACPADQPVAVTTGCRVNGVLNQDCLGTAGDDLIIGTSGNDIIRGGDGKDSLRGAGGDDLLCGEEGNDTLLGGNGMDTLVGADGDDVLKGERDEDILLGGPDKDILRGGNHDDQLDGEDGDDKLFGDGGEDLLEGGLGNDTLDGGGDTDTCTDVDQAGPFTRCP